MALLGRRVRGTGGATEPVRAWLLRGEQVAGLDALGIVYLHEGRDAWREHGPALLEEWAVAFPGTRPYAWFAYAECVQRHETWPEGLVCPLGAERRQVGGTGEQSCVWEEDERFYAIHGCDPADPPRIESMPTFLRRLGLLLPGEAGRVRKRAWSPVRLTVDPEGWAPVGAGGWEADE
jgi:hypothetical protein